MYTTIHESTRTKLYTNFSKAMQYFTKQQTLRNSTQIRQTSETKKLQLYTTIQTHNNLNLTTLRTLFQKKKNFCNLTTLYTYLHNCTHTQFAQLYRTVKNYNNFYNNCTPMHTSLFTPHFNIFTQSTFYKWQNLNIIHNFILHSTNTIHNYSKNTTTLHITLQLNTRIHNFTTTQIYSQLHNCTQLRRPTRHKSTQLYTTPHNFTTRLPNITTHYNTFRNIEQISITTLYTTFSIVYQKLYKLVMFCHNLKKKSWTDYAQFYPT